MTKVLIGILLALVVVTVAVAGYTDYQRRQVEKRVANLQRSLVEAQKQIDAVDDYVGHRGSLYNYGFGNGNDDLTSRVDQLCNTVTSAAC